jgi:hypothetical protein
MNAEAARLAAKKKRANDVSSIPARVYSRIQDRAAAGRRFLLCATNKDTRNKLKDDGFRIIFLYKLTLVRW